MAAFPDVEPRADHAAVTVVGDELQKVQGLEDPPLGAKVVTGTVRDSSTPPKRRPLDRRRDRLQFEIAYTCGARASESCGPRVEDFDPRQDDNTPASPSKSGTVRTVLLDDRGYVALVNLYLARTGYTCGPMSRASINGTGHPLSCDAAHHRWNDYRQQTDVEIDIHQLRHANATELINAGVSPEAVRRRLGHANAETTWLYTLLDKVADAEIRAARRRRDRRR